MLSTLPIRFLSTIVGAALCAGAASGQVSDFCSNAPQFTGDAVISFDTNICSDTGAASTTGSLPSNACGNLGNGDTWVRWTATVTGDVLVTTCPTASFDTTLAVYAACNGPELACNDDGGCASLLSTLNFQATVGTDYQIQIASFSQNVHGSGTLVIIENGVAPAGDECSDALVLTKDVPMGFNTSGHTTSLPAWTCASGGKDIWFEYTGQSNGDVTFDLCQSSYDTAIEVFSGSCGAFGLPTVCNDDACALQSSATVPAVLGENFFVRVGGFNSNSGAGVILVTEAPAVIPGDECLSALSVLPGVLETFDTTLATTGSEPWFCGDSVQDLWFHYVPQASGSVVFSTCGSSFDTTLEVYDSSCFTLQSPVACNDDSCGLQSEVLVNVLANVSYSIRIAGLGGDFGPGQLLVTELPNVAPGDECSNAILLPLDAFTNFDTSIATESPEAWNCAGASFQDLWFQLTPRPERSLLVGSTATGDPLPYEVYASVDGSCSNLILLDCGDGLGGSIASRYFADPALYAAVFLRVGSTPGNTGVNNIRYTDLTPLGTYGCSPTANSSGLVPSTIAFGQNTASANNFHLRLQGMPAGKFGYFLNSDGFNATGVMPPSSDGLLCLSGAIGRHNRGHEIFLVDPTGHAQFRVQLGDLPTPFGTTQVTAGETWHFQAWYRDNNPGQTSNFTDVASILFQ